MKVGTEVFPDNRHTQYQPCQRTNIDKKYTLACKGDTLPALLVWFRHNLAGFSNSNNDFCCFLSVTNPYYDGPCTLLETY
jgi:hypothetical protein